MPGGSLLFDERAAKATQEWDKLMSSEAVQNMSKTLKGASTDFEMRKFIEQLADTSTPPEIRKNIINRLLKLSDRQRDINQTRMDQLRGGSYYKPGGGQSSGSGLNVQGSIPEAAIQELKRNPKTAEQFDEIFGTGAAAKVLGVK